MTEFSFIGALTTANDTTRVVNFKLTTQNDASATNVTYAVFIDEVPSYKIEFCRDDGNEFVAFYSTLKHDENKVIGMLLSAIVHIQSCERIWITEEFTASAIREYCKNGDYPEIQAFNEIVNSQSALLVYYRTNKIKVHYQQSQFKCNYAKQASILDAALKSQVNINHLCKSGVCGKCRLNLVSGLAMETSETTEPDLLGPHQILACNYKALTSLEVG
ncbi:2Fe-2S iron-sulfur cluster-binding protein [Vibrio rumoiensis]|uniref:2Fe-2S iron-sulfur cluster-binding protein n=1 Tax=Vibrio rumoiensis TaxID=76258 RepID=UPI003AA96370